jgi:hypothetical protein
MFRLEAVAKNQLGELASRSRCSDPIAMLSKRSGVFSGNADFESALSLGDSSKIEDAAKQIAGKAPSELMLEVSFYDRLQLPGADIVDIDGVGFMLPKPLLAFLEDITLRYDGRFFLQDSTGQEIDLPIGPV